VNVVASLNDPLWDFVIHLSSDVHIRGRATGSRLNQVVTSEKLLNQWFLLLKSLQPSCTAL
jgi:hypothetical protein